MINELQLSPEDAYDRIAATVDGVNKVISSYVAALASQAPSEHKKGTEELAKQWRVAFEAGTVVVASGYQGWGFSCSTLADLYVDCSGRAVVIASACSPLFLTACVNTCPCRFDASGKVARDEFYTMATAAAASRSKLKKFVVAYGLQPMYVESTHTRTCSLACYLAHLSSHLPPQLQVHELGGTRQNKASLDSTVRLWPSTSCSSDGACYVISSPDWLRTSQRTSCSAKGPLPGCSSSGSAPVPSTAFTSHSAALSHANRVPGEGVCLLLLLSPMCKACFLTVCLMCSESCCGCLWRGYCSL